MGQNKWEVKSNSYQIADTGDYDGYWEVTNGEIKICTKDDGNDMEVILKEVAALLNKTEISFYIDNPKEVDLHFECEGLKIQLSELQTKYDNILATESGHESQTENVWQSGYAAGHDEGYKKALKGTENITSDWQTLQSKITTLEQSCNEKNTVITELNNTVTNLRAKCDGLEALIKRIYKDGPGNAEVIKEVNEAISKEGEKEVGNG
jgi:flagellar biosynthesis/type III secretory pathway protein FliH